MLELTQGGYNVLESNAYIFFQKWSNVTSYCNSVITLQFRLCCYLHYKVIKLSAFRTDRKTENIKRLYFYVLVLQSADIGSCAGRQKMMHGSTNFDEWRYGHYFYFYCMKRQEHK